MGWKKIVTEESEFKTKDVLSIGWHTIAINGEGMATARFLLSDNRSAQQSSVITFYASHVEGEGNQITLLSSTNFLSTNITQTALRIKESGEGMGAVLQVFIASETNKPIVQLLGDNYKNSTPGGTSINNGWNLTNFIPDGSESPDITLISNNEWDSFTQATRLNLNTNNLGLATTGNISGKASSIGTLTTLELNDGSIIDNSEFITITVENTITNLGNDNVNLIFNDIAGTNTDGSFPSLFSIANSGEEGNINVDYNIFGKLGYSPIITQIKLYAGFGNFESDLYKIKIFGSNTPFTGGNLGTLLYEDLDYVNGVGVDYPYIVNFQNETPFKYYRTQYISNSNNNSNNLISIYEIYYSEGVETTIKDSTVTTNNIVLSTNTVGTTSDDIVVRDSSGNLKTIGANLLSPSNLWYNGTTYLSSSKEVHIHAPNPVLVLKDTTDDDDHQIQFQDNSGNVDYKITTAGDIFNIHTVSNTPIAFHTNNVERMRILNGGNVGIGTDVPHLPFHVKGNARVEGYLMAGSAAAANTPSAPLHIKNSGTAFIRLEDLDSSNSIYDISVDQGSGFSIKEDSNTRLFIKDGGSVGIGTTSPSEKLHVVGDIFSSADIHAHNAIGTPPSTAVLLDLNDLNNETAHEFYWANFVSVTGGVDSTAWYSDTRLPNRWFNGSNSATDYAGWNDNLTPNTDTDDIDIRYKIANKLNYKPIVTKVVITQNASGNYRAKYFKIYGQNEGESLTLLTTSDTIETNVKSLEFVNNTAYDDIIIRIANTDDGITSGDVSGILINQINIYGSAPSTATFDKFIGILEGTADNSKKIKIQSPSVSAGGGSFRLTLADTDETIGNSQPLYSDATLIYDIDTDTLTVPTITATTINTKVLRYQEFSADWGTSTQKRYLPLSNAISSETPTTNIFYSRYIFTDDVAVSDVKIEMRMERSMNFKLEVRHHPLGGTLSNGFNQFNSNGFVYNNSNVFEHVLDSGPEGGFNKGDFLYIAIDPITGTSPGEVNGHLIICYDNEQTLTPGTNTAPNPISSESE